VVGSGTAALYGAYRAAGFDPTRMPIASLTTSEAEVAEMGAEAAEGHINRRTVFETLSSATARRFVSNFKEKYGADAPVTAGAEASYFQLHLAMRAVAKCGSDDPEQVLVNLRDPNSTRRRGGCGSIWKTITPTSGRGLRASTATAASRRSGIRACASSRTPTVSSRAWTTGRGRIATAPFMSAP